MRAQLTHGFARFVTSSSYVRWKLELRCERLGFGLVSRNASAAFRGLWGGVCTTGALGGRDWVAFFAFFALLGVLNNAARRVCASCSAIVVEELRGAPRFSFRKASVTAAGGPADVADAVDVALDRGRAVSPRLSS